MLAVLSHRQVDAGIAPGQWLEATAFHLDRARVLVDHRNRVGDGIDVVDFALREDMPEGFVTQLPLRQVDRIGPGAIERFSRASVPNA